MTITLTPEQLQRLQQLVAEGRFESVDEAVRLAVADLMAADSDDLVWARPLVDAARESVANGEGMPADTVKAEMDEYLKSIGAR
jgi:Arc/MetJ-type ribon-helix-helix transcriptional regulator